MVASSAKNQSNAGIANALLAQIFRHSTHRPLAEIA